MEQNFLFQCTPLEPDALVPQVSQALEVRMEFVSRAVCPKLWAATDRLNRNSNLRMEVFIRESGYTIASTPNAISLILYPIVRPRYHFLLWMRSKHKVDGLITYR